MSLKGDPDLHLKKTLKKWKLEETLPEISRWLEREPGSPGTLKVLWICEFNTEGPEEASIGYYDVDLKDPTSWGNENMWPMPSDDFFLELYKAIKADDKRRASRASYEF